MILSEADARTKWCHAAKAVSIAGGVPFVSSRPAAGKPADPSLLCIASDCMAWRRAQAYAGRQDGYCGLAGKPD